MKKLLGNKSIARALDEPREKEEFYRELKAKAGGGVTKDELREVLGKFRTGHGKFISSKEAFDVAREIFPEVSSRYKYSSSWDLGKYSAKETPKTNIPNNDFSNSKLVYPISAFTPRTVSDFKNSNNISAVPSSKNNSINQNHLSSGKTSGFSRNSPSAGNLGRAKSSFSEALRITMLKNKK